MAAFKALCLRCTQERKELEERTRMEAEVPRRVGRGPADDFQLCCKEMHMRRVVLEKVRVIWGCSAGRTGVALQSLTKSPRQEKRLREKEQLAKRIEEMEASGLERSATREMQRALIWALRWSPLVLACGLMQGATTGEVCSELSTQHLPRCCPTVPVVEASRIQALWRAKKVQRAIEV